MAQVYFFARRSHRELMPCLQGKEAMSVAAVLPQLYFAVRLALPAKHYCDHRAWILMNSSLLLRDKVFMDVPYKVNVTASRSVVAEVNKSCRYR